MTRVAARAVALSAVLALLVAAVAKPIIVVHPNDIMDSPQPKASLSRWTAAPRRSRITFAAHGALLRGYSYAGDAGNGLTLVVFGGSGNLIERHDAAMRGFARDVRRVQWYDYRGYGFSGGRASYTMLLSDAARIFDDTARRAGGASHVIVLGYSMGTNVALHIAAVRRPRALILAAPWSDFIATSEYQDPKHRYVMDAAAARLFDNVALAQQSDVALLVFQGTRDDAIPPSQGAALERGALSRDKRFVPIAGAKHDWLLEQPASQAAVRAFIFGLR